MYGREDEKRLELLAKTFGRIQNAESLAWKVNEKRLEDAWFIYQLVWFYKSITCLWPASVLRQVETTEEISRSYVNLQIYKDLSIHQSGLHTAVKRRGVEKDLLLLMEMKRSTDQYVLHLNLE